MAAVSKTELRRLQKMYKTDARIGQELGITRQAVHQMRKKYGLNSIRDKNPERNEDIVRMKAEGIDVNTIAKRYNVSVPQVYRILSIMSTDTTSVSTPTKKKRGRPKKDKEQVVPISDYNELQEKYDKVKQVLEETKSGLDEIENNSEEIKGQLKIAKEEIKRLIDKEQEQIDAINKCSVSIDFSRIHAFSIERMVRAGQEVTIIGHILEGSTKEWTLYCSRKRHEKLVEEFNEHRGE